MMMSSSAVNTTTAGTAPPITFAVLDDPVNRITVLIRGIYVDQYNMGLITYS